MKTECRRLRFLIACLLVACIFPQVHAQAPAAQPYQASAPLSWELKNARWFDGRQIQRGSLYVENGVFVAKKPAKVNRKMDLRGQQVLINPLGEAHNHNLQTAWGWAPRVSLDQGLARVRHQHQHQHKHQMIPSYRLSHRFLFVFQVYMYQYLMYHSFVFVLFQVHNFDKVLS